MNRLNLNLSIGYQNIEGQHNLLGCKLGGQIELFNGIEILAETWSECENCKKIAIENYDLVKSIDPLKIQGRKGRKSGGIHIYCKSFLKPHLKIIKAAKHYIWFGVDKNIFEELSISPIFCAIYSQPKTSEYYSEDLWEELECNILSLTSHDPSNPTPFCIIGDMNDRVAEDSKFINMNLVDSKMLNGRLVKETKRRNCDKVKCNIGNKIINMCKSYDMQIANGRLSGDFLGNFTHFNKNQGKSVVDLALLSDSLFQFVDDFKVLPQQVFSDYCKIVLTLKNMKKLEVKNNGYIWLKKKPCVQVGY